MEVIAIDHVHFYVEETKSWQKWFEQVWQFRIIDEYANQTEQTVVLGQGKIFIYLSMPLKNNSPVAKYLEQHPAGLAEVAFISTKTVPPITINNVKHLFYSQPNYALPNLYTRHLVHSIDHLVINVPYGEMLTTAQWYQHNLGLRCGDRFDIASANSGLQSVVLHNANRQVQIPINQPVDPQSQIQEFLDRNGGAGVQHLALATADIYTTVQKLERSGVKFLATKPKILVEQQSNSALLQIFTEPIFTQPTFFLEIIERQGGAVGFGERNFKALFDAVETAQLARQS
jgi:4-hydroxyphenylpyruvate dioxygenase and related hemolysins